MGLKFDQDMHYRMQGRWDFVKIWAHWARI